MGCARKLADERLDSVVAYVIFDGIRGGAAGGVVV
jgi:hypothetical protein